MRPGYQSPHEVTIFTSHWHSLELVQGRDSFEPMRQQLDMAVRFARDGVYSPSVPQSGDS